MKFNLLHITTFILGLMSCNKDSVDLGENPFTKNNDNTQQTDTVNSGKIDSVNIFSLHQDLFLPTCANSGCHDGNFEPDFRTVESTYYGLVNKPVIKADIGGKFPYRVVPFQHQESMLWQRLHVDLNGNSGIMPLSLEPNSDYPQRKTQYLNRLKQWIDAGAKDQFGNLPLDENFPPVIKGIRLMQNNRWLPRVGIYEPVVVSNQSGPVQIYLSLYDQEASFSVTNNVNVYLSTRPDSFGVIPTTNLQEINDEVMTGLFNETTNYRWKFELDPQKYKVDQVLWMRFELDHDSKTFQLPSNTSMFFLKKYAAIKIQL